jgi:hypothetical protein
MPITFNCPCGKALRVADEHAGRRVKCPACNAVGTVPAPEPEFEVVEDEQLAPTPAPAKGRPVAKPAASRDDDDDDDGRGYGVAKADDDEDDKPRAKKKPDFRKGSGRTDDDDDEDEDRPKKKKRKKRPPEKQESGRSFEGNVINGGVGIGVLVMIIAVVWFVVGLANDIIFFYPPVLFIIGLVAFFKGLTGQE